jgi:hypothetical protein
MSRYETLPDGMSPETYRHIIAEHEAALAALADACIDDLPPFGSNIGPATTDDEIDEMCTQAVRR